MTDEEKRKIWDYEVWLARFNIEMFTGVRKDYAILSVDDELIRLRARIKVLEEKLYALKGDGPWIAYDARIKLLQSRLDKLQKVADAARKWDVHMPYCALYVGERTSECDCGLADCVATLQEVVDPYAAQRAYEDEHDCIKMGKKKWNE